MLENRFGGNFRSDGSDRDEGECAGGVLSPNDSVLGNGTKVWGQKADTPTVISFTAAINEPFIFIFC